MKKVDIHMLTYNSEKFIRGTLDSILSNDYEKFCVKISDDASSDNTVEILKEYKIKYPERIKIYEQKKNLGIFENSNFLIEKLDSDITMFTGHDDLFTKDKITKCVKAFEKNDDVTLVYHDAYVEINGENKFKFSDTHYPQEGNAHKYLIYGCFSTAMSVCVKTDLLKKLKYKKEGGQSSDFLMMYEMAKQGTIKYVPEVLGSYRIHGANATISIKNSEDFDSVRSSLYILENYPEDRIYTIINLNWALIKLFWTNKKHFLFYLVSPLISFFWILRIKIGKKKIH